MTVGACSPGRSGSGEDGMGVEYRLATILCWRIDAICDYISSSSEITNYSCAYLTVISTRNVCCCLVSSLICADSKLFCAKRLSIPDLVASGVSEEIDCGSK